MHARTAAIAAMGVLAGCNSPTVTQPHNEDTVNATLEVQAVNQAANFGQGPVTPGEQGNISSTEQMKPEQVLAAFVALLHDRKFADAFSLVDGQAMNLDEKGFEARFDSYRTIYAAVGRINPTEGAAGSLYSQIQLTLSGNRDSGAPYVVTGPVTLRRVNDVPGSTAKQRRWRIVKMQLAADPKAVETLVKK